MTAFGKHTHMRAHVYFFVNLDTKCFGKKSSLCVKAHSHLAAVYDLNRFTKTTMIHTKRYTTTHLNLARKHIASCSIFEFQ